MIDGIHIEKAFDDLKDTSFFEKYMLNSFQFSAAKSVSEMRWLQSLIFDENKVKRSYNDFRKLAGDVQTKMEHWFRVEYDLASRGAVMANKWNEIYNDRDIYPFFIYETRGDAKVRPEHAILNGKKFRIDSTVAQNIFPPNGWSCRCTVDQSDNGDNVLTDKETNKYLTGKVGKIDIVAPQFRKNVGIEGIMPNEKYDYQKGLKNANESNHTLFDSNVELTHLNSFWYDEYKMQLAVNEWGKDIKENEIIFRNHTWLMNIKLSEKILNKVGKRSKGFENIKHTIEHPAEIWAKWDNVNDQKIVVLNFITYDKNNAYIVSTKNGNIFDFYYKKHTDSKNLRRTGIKLLK